MEPGNALLRPPVSRNPFALREQSAAWGAETAPTVPAPLHSDAGRYDTSRIRPAAESPSFPDTIPVRRPVGSLPTEAQTYSLIPQARMEHLQPAVPPLFPQTPEQDTREERIFTPPPEDPGTRHNQRENRTSKEIRPAEKVLSVRHLVEKTASAQKTELQVALAPIQQTREDSYPVLPQQEDRPLRSEPNQRQQADSLSLAPRLTPAHTPTPHLPQTRAQKIPPQPKLIIGKLTVELVQSPVPAVQTVVRPPQTQATQSPSNGSNARYKLKFGLGQL